MIDRETELSFMLERARNTKALQVLCTPFMIGVSHTLYLWRQVDGAVMATIGDQTIASLTIDELFELFKVLQKSGAFLERRDAPISIGTGC